MKKAALILGISFASLSFAQSFEPHIAALKETVKLTKTINIFTSDFLPCQPLAGTSVNVTARVPIKNNEPESMSQVEILEGQCKSTIGWVNSKSLDK